MTVAEYESYFHAFFRHAMSSIFTKSERIRKFAKRLTATLFVGYNSVSECDSFQSIGDYYKRVEGIHHDA